ncbi:hypothetical protein ACFVYP_07160 [Kitasatospora sp. NPDC058201]|uniref:hypothetical protein n=1 Tax=unclassified Kitasatospora TaxID=2633591 RepID=UPI003660A733
MSVATRGDQIREHALSTTYTLTAPGLAEASSHPSLEDAITALAAIIRTLPLRPDRASAYLWMIAGPGGADRVLDFLERDGRFQLAFVAAGQRYVVTIR